MKKSYLIVFLLFLAVIIVVVIVGDFGSTKLENRPGNQYELDVDEFKAVDPSLITYRETKNYMIQAEHVAGIAYSDNKLYVVGDQFLQVIHPDGTQIFKTSLPDHPTCVEVSDNGLIIVGFRNFIGKYSEKGEQIWIVDTLGSKSVITAVAIKDPLVFVADAGKRIVHRYNMEGEYLDSFEGKTGGKDLHGFIIPSANFDLKVNNDGELWVVNPGKHSLENYTDDGKLRAHWENSSVKIDGFSGCCNPAHIALLPDGSFVTSEKLLVRIKVYKPSGEFLAVVAPPTLFEEDGKAPDIAVDDNGSVYALDYYQNKIRVFEPK